MPDADFGNHPEAVVLILEDPALVVERSIRQGREHRLQPFRQSRETGQFGCAPFKMLRQDWAASTYLRARALFVFFVAFVVFHGLRFRGFGFRGLAVAAVTLSRFGRGLGFLAAILGERPAYIVALFDAAFGVAPDIALVAARAISSRLAAFARHLVALFNIASLKVIEHVQHTEKPRGSFSMARRQLRWPGAPSASCRIAPESSSLGPR